MKGRKPSAPGARKSVSGGGRGTMGTSGGAKPARGTMGTGKSGCSASGVMGRSK